MKHLDKIKHAAAGFVLMLGAGLASPTLGLLVVALAAWFKEDRDRRNPARHTFDGWDAYATVFGAVPALAIVEFVPVLRLLGMA